MLSSLSPRRRLLVVAMVVAVALAAATVGAAALVGRAVPEVARPAEVPVLLVPGYDGAPGSLDTLAAHLRAGGRRVVVVALPDRGTGDLRASARVLAGAVDRTGAVRVDLVGFSVGGVVVRVLLAEPALATRARRVVLLGAPNHGAELAGAAAALDPGLCPGACAQLVPGSAFLAELNRDETPTGPQFWSVWTEYDQTVTPPASAELDGAANVRLQDVCAGIRVGHGGLVRDRLALGLVAGALDGSLARSPGPGDCAALSARGG